MRSRFDGEWKYLERAVFTLSEGRANKAALELALFLRTLDDREQLSAYRKESAGKAAPSGELGLQVFGQLFFEGKPPKALSMRDVTNKIIHAAELEWSFPHPDHPHLICRSHEREKWLRAEVDVVALARFCGLLMS